MKSNLLKWSIFFGFCFLFFFVHCQTKWICLIVVEWGLWNNSWVKNLPVRPLAPRRKTPGPAVPHIQWPPGLGQKYSKTKYLCWGWVLAVTVSTKLYEYINTKLAINNDGWYQTLLIPASSLLVFELLYGGIDESLTSLPNLLFFSAWEEKK